MSKFPNIHYRPPCPYPLPSGEAIAQSLSVTYNGPQFKGDKVAYFTFTDPQTGSTFGATDLESARKTLAEMREKFKKVPHSVSHKQYVQHLKALREQYPYPQYSAADLNRMLHEQGIWESPEDVKEQEELENEAEREETSYLKEDKPRTKFQCEVCRKTKTVYPVKYGEPYGTMVMCADCAKANNLDISKLKPIALVS